MTFKPDAAAKSDIPQPGTSTPPTESVAGAAGSTATKFAMEDHSHPRVTSTTYVTLDSTGQAFALFTRSFTNKPGLDLTETDATATSQPLSLRGLAWQQDANGRYYGVTIQGKRARVLPQLNALSGVLTLLTQVVTGVNSLVTALTGYDLFAGVATGATVTVIAIARSDVAST